MQYAAKSSISSNSSSSPLMTSVPPNYPKKYSICRCCGASTFVNLQWDLRDNGKITQLNTTSLTQILQWQSYNASARILLGDPMKKSKIE